ncbi:MAG: T9SS type A sorting domain-containing protein [Bacteroidota bacterium]
MTRILLVCCLSWGSINAQSIDPPILLQEVNTHWSDHPDAFIEDFPDYPTEEEKITFHLLHVIAYLRAHQPAQLSLQQINHRNTLLASLKVYAEAGIFPKNIHHPIRTPYFIDHLGTHCAVGHMMEASGHEALARQIQQEHNYDYLADIKTSGVESWASTHGFELDELAWIQPAYAPTTPFASVGGEVDGPVTHMVASDDRIYFAGDFLVMDSMPCMGIGYLEQDQMYCMDDLPPGTIESLSDILFMDFPKTMYLVGSLKHDGNTYPAARRVDSGWEFISVPLRPQASGLALLDGYDIWKNGGFERIELGIIISPPDQSELQELWHRDPSGNWELIMTVYGQIHSTAQASTRYYYGGKFDSVKVQFPLQTPEMVYSQNFLEVNFETETVIAFDSGLPDTVWQIYSPLTTWIPWTTSLYISGSCGRDPGRSEVCVTRYLNEDLQPLILMDNLTTDSSAAIYDMVLSENRLMFVGDIPDINPFNAGVVSLTFGSHFGYYTSLENIAIPEGVFNAPIRQLLEYGGEYYLGGDFTQMPSPYLVRTGFGPTNIAPPTAWDIRLSPNPVQDYVQVQGLLGPADYEVYQIEGKKVMEGQSIDHRLDVSTLSPGIYLLKVHVGSQSQTLKLVKT